MAYWLERAGDQPLSISLHYYALKNFKIGWKTSPDDEGLQKCIVSLFRILQDCMNRWESFSVYALASQYNLFDAAMKQFTWGTVQLKNISFLFLKLEDTYERSESQSIPIRLIPFNIQPGVRSLAVRHFPRPHPPVRIRIVWGEYIAYYWYLGVPCHR